MTTLILALLLTNAAISSAALVLSLRAAGSRTLADAVDDGIALAERMGALAKKKELPLLSSDKLGIALQYAQSEKPRVPPARLRKLIEIRLQRSAPSVDAGKRGR
jgi:hypothetical protein